MVPLRPRRAECRDMARGGLGNQRQDGKTASFGEPPGFSVSASYQRCEKQKVHILFLFSMAAT